MLVHFASQSGKILAQMVKHHHASVSGIVSTYGILVLQDWQLNRDGNSLLQPEHTEPMMPVLVSQPSSGHGTEIWPSNSIDNLTGALHSGHFASVEIFSYLGSSLFQLVKAAEVLIFVPVPSILCGYQISININGMSITPVNT